MKHKDNLLESIYRFKTVFWEKRSMDRPPVAVIDPDLFLPMKLVCRHPIPSELHPGDIDYNIYQYESSYIQKKGHLDSDDWIPFCAPWRAIPWLEAICGCEVHCTVHTCSPVAYIESVATLSTMDIQVNRKWQSCLEEQTRRLVRDCPELCWISPTILRGSSDVIASMRGLTNFYCDLYDDLGAVDRMADKVTDILIDLLQMHFSIVRPYQGGYGHIYGYWAPEKTVVLQEDALGMCAPLIFKKVFQKYQTRIIRSLGGRIFFHLHSTGYQHYRDVLDIPGLDGIQLTVEKSGPSLEELIPDLCNILESSRLILFVDHGVEKLNGCFSKLPKEGLYLLISQEYISSHADFKHFIRQNW